MDARASIYAAHPVKNPWELTKAELEKIPKVLLLKYWSRYIHVLWDRLPKHFQADSEIISYLPCTEHWNMPDMLDHIDGSAPPRRKCDKCCLKAVEDFSNREKLWDAATLVSAFRIKGGGFGNMEGL